MNSVIKGQKYVYRYYGLFVLKKKFQIFAIDNYFICNLSHQNYWSILIFIVVVSLTTIFVFI